MAFFSVIIPTFNRLPLLKEALNSVWRQTFSDYEVIVIDDGSTDGTAEYLQSRCERMRFFRQTNKGPGAARNLGVSNARGEYLAFLDSDDLWFPWTLDVYRRVIYQGSFPALLSGLGVPLGWESTTQWRIKSVRTGNLLEACNSTMPPVGGIPSVAVRAGYLQPSRRIYGTKNQRRRYRPMVSVGNGTRIHTNLEAPRFSTA